MRTKTIVIFFLMVVSSNVFSQEKEKPSGSFSGVFFMDYYYSAVRDTGFASLPNTLMKEDKDIHGFKVRRIYFTYDYKHNSRLSSKFRLESDEANFTSNLAGDKAVKFNMFVKDAYIKWNYIGRHNVYIGIQGTPGFEVSEKVWGNRYIEKTIMDVRGIHPSRDLGISFRGQFDSVGVFKYWFMFANGTASLPENNKYKRYAVNFEINPIKNFRMTLMGDFQQRAQIENIFSTGNKINNNILTASFFVGYMKKDKFNAGIEAYYRITQNGTTLTNNYEDLAGMGVSVFATYHFGKKFNVFGRFDNFEPNLNADAKGDTRNMIIAGFAFKPYDKFTISPNVYIETFEKIGNRDVTSSVTPRITINYAF